MINVICVVHRLTPYGPRPNAPDDPSTPHFDGSQVKVSSLFNSEFKFLLIHKSDFHVTEFSYGPNTCDVVGRVSRSRTTSNVATTAASSWMLATTASNRPFRSEFQHPSPTFRPRILATAVVRTSSWRASPTVGNSSVDDTDTAAATIFFFATNSKSFVPTFNCSIHNTSKCRASRLLVHLYLQVSFIGGTRLH
jgi:hypothetical protein